MEKINRLNIGDHLLEYQLSLIGKTIEEAKEVEEWYCKWTISKEKWNEFEKYAINLIKKIFHCNKAKAQYTFQWFNLEFGLRVKD